jgi:alkylation response protein AidB-like acyl-CoA dehydrogenase
VTTSALAITDEHRDLADAASGYLRRADALKAARATLDGETAHPAHLWRGQVALGWTGLAVDERYGGSGFGLAELWVVLEAMGRELCPGPFMPTVVLAAWLNHCGSHPLKDRYLPALAEGSVVGAVTTRADLDLDADGRLSGNCPAVLCAQDAQVLALVVGDDVVVLESSVAGVAVTGVDVLDNSRHVGDVVMSGVRIGDGQLIRHGARSLGTVVRILSAAEALGASLACLEMACDYAKVREQFGRTIGHFQAVKHHLANMLVDTELTTAATWDAARADDLDSAEFAAAVALSHAVRTSVKTAQMNIQLHGGVGFTWEHNAHLYLRRAKTFAALSTNGAQARRDVVAAQRSGRAHGPAFTLPDEADQYREAAGSVAAAVRALPASEQRDALADSRYLVPHWPKPGGRGAGPTEQLVIENELAGITLPDMGITEWVMLTIVETGTDDQRSRWVEPALRGQEAWCQLFSEPNAGSDAAAIRTSAIRIDGGWRVTGQKVWTSNAHNCRWGLATVRTDPGAAKHRGVTMMAIDLHADGVTIRPLREMTGESLFNEVFFDEVLVPDCDVVGEVGQGWQVARATLGNERVTLGGTTAGVDIGPDNVIELLDDAPPPIGSELLLRTGEVLAEWHTQRPLNMRFAARALAGAGPGPEANVTKLVNAECAQRITELAMELVGVAAATGRAKRVTAAYLMTRCFTIAGGTSEIIRNTIAERILSLPRDPLLT